MLETNFSTGNVQHLNTCFAVLPLKQLSRRPAFSKKIGSQGGTPNSSCGNHQLTSLDPNLQVVREDRWVRECVEVMYVKRLYQCDIDEFATTFCVLGCDVNLLNGLFSLTLLICLPVYCCVFCWKAGVQRDKVVVTPGGQALWLFFLECHQKK